jgi:hypothetical protein
MCSIRVQFELAAAAGVCAWVRAVVMMPVFFFIAVQAARYGNLVRE